ncbi:hypothetical protein [Deinococcus yunweiensis]|uniref:hypothetical protein n=1 Tax=Deinococcus yunweiensis TaxID=367282 RepID=UPI00398F5FDE
MTQDTSRTPDFTTLASLGLFAERRISRGAAQHGEREVSDAIMQTIRDADLSAVTTVQTGGQMLPDDALERLKAVKGIGDELAKQALDALTNG